ncbi:MAG TPA: hypothetical protein VJ718_00070, partial [Candidatus Binataceae bacterium]|nr:hypothetical protein [Candidatus Binataceae bacterium]
GAMAREWRDCSSRRTMENDLKPGNACDAALYDAGILAHYVGDASQPLHTTKYYDGYTYSDRGAHRRFEGAVDRDATGIEAAARPLVRVEQIDSVWDAAVAEIGRAHALAPEVIRSDRAARSQMAFGKRAYESALMRADSAMVAKQVADAASVLASIWIYEWKRAGSPSYLPFSALD